MYGALDMLRFAVGVVGLAANPAGDVFVDISVAPCAGAAGTAADPLCSVQTAVDMAMPGDTIHIAPGIYVENVFVSKDLTLIGTAGSSATFIEGKAGVFKSVVEIPEATDVTIEGLTLRKGLAPSTGGGIRCEGDMVLRNSTLTENRTNTFGNGGGIGSSLGSANIVIENCSITHNEAFAGVVAAISANCDSLKIYGSTISNNLSDSVFAACCGAINVGGGAAGCLLIIENSTISDNLGNELRAIVRPGSRISNTTIFGGPNFVQVAAYGQLDIENTIIAHAGTSSNGLIYGDLNSLGNNLIGATAPYGTTIVDGVNGDLFGPHIDALLGPLQDNGGPTMTHALLPGSPALDAGNSQSFAAVDQRGFPRPFGSAPDIGAYESGMQSAHFCNGDGGDQMGCLDCPCTNNAHPATAGGCLNSTGLAGSLRVSGSPSVALPSMSTDDLRFRLSGIMPFTFSVLASGDTVAPTNPTHPCFGSASGVLSSVYDGLRCAVGQLRRHGGRPADGNGNIGTSNAPWGGEGAPPAGLAHAFGGFSAGQTRFFQAVYRDDPMAVCMRGLNTTQAIQVTFTP